MSTLFPIPEPDSSGDASRKRGLDLPARHTPESSGVIPLADEAVPIDRPSRSPGSPPVVPTTPGATTKGSAAEEDLVTTICRGCGYDLRGSVSRRCPKCGAIRALRRRRRAVGREEYASHLLRRHAFVLACFGVGASLIVMALLLAIGGGRFAALYPVVIGAQTLATLLAYLLFAFLWLGSDDPIRVLALRMFAICATTDLAIVGLYMPGIPLVPELLCALLFICLLMAWSELEYADAIIAGMPLAVIKIVVLWSAILLFTN